MSSNSQEHPRIRRLRMDAEELNDLAQHSDYIQVRVIDPAPGMPPDKYEITYLVKGVIGHSGTQLQLGDRHVVRVSLGQKYPLTAPGLKWVTEVWHPNIHHTSKDVCIDQRFWAPQRGLRDLVIMMGEMIQGKNVFYKMEPPYPLDHEAATWYRDYVDRQRWDSFHPVDTRPLLRQGESTEPTKAPSRIRLRPDSEVTSSLAAEQTASIPPPNAAPSRVRIRRDDEPQAPGSSDTDGDTPPTPGRIRIRPLT